MKMIPISDFLPHLRKLVDVPLPSVMESAIIRSAQRFCRESKAITYPRTLPEVFDCQTVAVVGKQFGSKGHLQLKGAGVVSVSSGDSLLSPSRDYAVTGLDEVRFYGDFKDIKIHGVAEPITDATELPEFLYSDYVDGICAGAASILQRQPNVEWFQPDLAQYNEREYVQAIRDAHRYKIENAPDFFSVNRERKREFY